MIKRVVQNRSHRASAALVGLLTLGLLLVVSCGESGGDPESEEESASSEATSEATQSTPTGTANVTRLTSTGRDGDPDISPDGERITFQSGQYDSGKWAQDIYAVNADGTGLTRLTNLGNTYAFALSPDGTKVAFGTTGRLSQPNEANQPFEIHVMNADGTGPTFTTQGGAPPIPIAWFPDGSKLAFQRVEGRPSDGIYVVNGRYRSNPPPSNAGYADGDFRLV